MNHKPIDKDLVFFYYILDPVPMSIEDIIAALGEYIKLYQVSDRVEKNMNSPETMKKWLKQLIAASSVREVEIHENSGGSVTRAVEIPVFA